MTAGNAAGCRHDFFGGDFLLLDESVEGDFFVSEDPDEEEPSAGFEDGDTASPLESLLAALLYPSLL